MSFVRVVLQLALRNIRASRLHLMIGAIVLCMAAFLEVAAAIVDSVQSSISRSVSRSISGDLQVYSASSEDELDLFGMLDNGPIRIDPIRHFWKVRDALQQDRSVAAAVPMGVVVGLVAGETPLDIELGRLRDGVRQTQSGMSAPDAPRAKAQVRHLVSLLKDQLHQAEGLMAAQETEDSRAALDRASSDGFWREFDANPYRALDFLDTQVAPLMADGEPLEVACLGTDLEQFRHSFNGLEVVKGQFVPSGQRGVMVSSFYYEEKLKLRNARRLDKIHEAIVRGHRIADDEDLQMWIKENQGQIRELLFQLDESRAQQAIDVLRRELHSQENDLETLLRKFFDMDDSSFERRYDLFYQQLAPLVQIYRLKIGDLLTMRAFDERGILQSVNVRLYGVFQFRGLGRSEFVGNANLMDLDSFRHLYGLPDDQQLAEERQILKEIGRDPLSEQSWSPPPVTNEIDETKLFSSTDRRERLSERLSPDHDGAVQSVAVVLRDPSQQGIVRKRLQGAVDAQRLNLRVVDWQDATGLLGKLVIVTTALLAGAVVVLFLVTLVVVSNAMIMATLKREREIGTMRAIGGQQPLVLSVVVAEAVVLATLAGTLGSALGAGVVQALHRSGLRAQGDALQFLFSGPRLYPSLRPLHAIFACAVPLVVCLAATISPALAASRVSPLRAMQGQE